MKILFLSHYFPPEGNAPASRVYEMAKWWVRSGHQVRVITCVPNVPLGKVYEGYRNRLYQREVVDGIEVVRVWTYLAANRGTVRRIMNYVSYMVMAIFAGLRGPRPDLLIATSPQFFCGWAGLLLSRLRRLRFILEIRDIWPESIVAVGALQRPRLVRLLERMEQTMYRKADHIITVGEGYRQRLCEKGVPVDKISVVMNGIDPEQFSPREPDRKLKRELGLNGEFVCSYVGTVGMACGLDIVLKAARLLKEMQRYDIRFMIVGDGAVRHDLEMQAIQQGLDNVLFLGRQPKERISSFLSISNACLIHLKKTDLFQTVMPSKIFEASGMAKPIILGVTGYAEEFVKQANAGIVIDPENADQLVRALLQLASDEELCQCYGISGYDYVRHGYTRAQQAECYIEILGNRVRGSKRSNRSLSNSISEV